MRPILGYLDLKIDNNHVLKSIGDDYGFMFACDSKVKCIFDCVGRKILRKK